MADPVSSFEAADAMRLSVAGSYSFSPDIGGAPGSFDSGSYCSPKKPGSLGLIVTAAELGFPGITFDIYFTGARSGEDANGRPLVRWTIIQSVDRYLPGPDVTVDRIDGHVTAALYPVGPFEDTACGGDCHPFTVGFETVGDDNQAVIQLHKTVLGVDHAVVLRFDEIKVLGIAAVNLSEFRVTIQQKQNECGVGAVAGGVATFWAWVHGPAMDIPATYQWTVSGAEPAGPTDTEKLLVAVPDPPNDFTVSLDVGLAGCVISARTAVRPLTRPAADLIERVCYLITHFSLVNEFFDPLGPDISIRSVVDRLGQLQQDAQRIAGSAARVLNDLEMKLR